MAISKEKERISARVPQHAYHTLTQAAEISGATLNQFLLQATLEKAGETKQCLRIFPLAKVVKIARLISSIYLILS